jgi:hypothetical protein
LGLRCAEIAPNFNDFWPTIRVKRSFENGPTQTTKDYWERFMWRDLSKALHELWRASGEGTSAYRPDLHYMRGPGPKWQAKYGNLTPKDSTAASSARPALREVAQHHA